MVFTQKLQILIFVDGVMGLNHDAFRSIITTLALRLMIVHSFIDLTRELERLTSINLYLKFPQRVFKAVFHLPIHVCICGYFGSSIQYKNKQNRY